MHKNKQLTSEQKYVIYLGLEEGASKRDIASGIGVHPSTVYRELKRNKNKRGGYSWLLAGEMAREREERLPENRSTPEWIKRKALKLLEEEEWSHRQISRHLKKDGNINISHETIYK